MDLCNTDHGNEGNVNIYCMCVSNLFTFLREGEGTVSLSFPFLPKVTTLLKLDHILSMYSSF